MITKWWADVRTAFAVYRITRKWPQGVVINIEPVDGKGPSK